MPIRTLKSNSIEQECSKCGAILAVPFDDINAGVEREGQLDGAVVPLKPCPECGSTEYLIRSPEDEPDHPSLGSFGHRHRLLTDKLHAQLVKGGHLAEGFSEENEPVVKEPSKKELNKWFKDGLRLKRDKEKHIEDDSSEIPNENNTGEGNVE